MHARVGVLLLPLLFVDLASGAEEPLVPPADGKPVLQLDAGGPMAAVTALAFAPDGKTLYIGGYDKLVCAWTLDEKTGRFTARAAYRIPIGPGLNGLINAVAVSPDGKQLAVAGSGAVRGIAGFGDTGVIVPLPGRLSPAMEKDWGAIYLFDLDKEGDPVRPLRGHRGPVSRLAFLPALKDKPPLLVSVGREGTDSIAVRLWDTAEGALLAERDDLPDLGGNEPPGLAAWHTGPGRRDVGMAVALAGELPGPQRKDPPPGRLLYWDAKEGGLKSWKLDGWFFTNTAAFRPGAAFEGVLFTADARPRSESRPAGACLQRWPVTDKGPQFDSDRTEFLAEKAVPKTLTLLPKRRDGAADLAAAVLALPPGKDDANAPSFRLALMGRAAQGGYGDVKASVKLWAGAGRPPAAAASPDGALLAVAGAPDHSVWVYSVADLLDNKTEPIQRIISTGAPVREVGFVRDKGANPGLLLREGGADGKGAGADWVLDVNGHKLQNGRDGWEDDAPAPGAWTVAVSDDGLTFTVRRGDKEVGVVHLAAGRPKTIKPRPTCRPALLPPAKPQDRALLAVAYLEQGVSYLELFDVAADRPARRLTGHVDAVHALAFRGDGRLLASAADDQTVAVWSLTDLDKVVQKGGGLPGFAVERKGENVAVSALDGASLSAGNREALKGAKVGDAVEGVVRGKTLVPVKSPQDVYDAVWAVKPGDSIILRIAGADVSLAVDQGEDERKPLFSFFMRDEAKDRLWLAWNPTGPYDADDWVRAEGVIGWQSNTGKPSAPVEFSPAAQYRKEAYRPGLLQYLVEKGDLSDALKKWNDAAPPKPGMGLRLEAPRTEFPRDGQGRVLVQGPPRGLRLRAELYDVLESKIKRVRWRFDDGAWRDFDRQSELTFTVDLDKADLNWRGRPHEFGLLVETLEAAPTDYGRRLPLSYAPPRPEITGGRADSLEVAAQTFPFQAEVVPAKGGPAGAGMRVTLRLNNGGPKAVGAKIDENLDLAEGDNFIEVRAENEGAPPETAVLETATRRWKVRYTPPKKVAPPTVYFESVSSAAEKPQDDKPLTVHGRTVRVRGRVTSAEPLVEVSCDGRALAVGGDKLDFSIDEEIPLKNAGEDTAVKFVARHGKGDPAAKTLVLKYEPPAPSFEFEPGAPEPAVAGNQETVPLRGRVVKAEGDTSTYKVEVRLNGKPIDGAELKDDRLAASLSLRPGDNTVEVGLSNPFDRRTAAAHCYRRRPPLVKSVTHTEAGAKPLVELTALVESPADRPLSGVRVASDAVPDLSPNYTLTKQPPLADGGNVQTWKVVVAGVPLKEGMVNRLRLWARNEDGESPDPAETAVAVAPKKPAAPPPPDVTVLEPRLTEEVVETPEGRLAFRVRWNGPAGEVAVLINGKEIGDAGLAPAPPADGTVTYRTDALPLESGPNIIQVRAVNGGGRRLSESCTLFYRQRTAVIRLTGLSAVRRTAAPDGPVGRGALLKFPKQDSAQVWIHGRVEWPDETDPVLVGNQPAHVRVWVNDFEQFEAPLGPRQGRAREFTAELRLNGAANRVEVASSDVKAEKATFGIACSRPAHDQRLHLLVVEPGRRDEGKVTEEVLTAFQARDVDGDHFASAAFRQGRLYGPVIKLAQREEVIDAVENMKSAISGGADELNDVIVVFFHGEQLATADDHFLLTGETQRLLPDLKPGEKLDGARLDKVKETALTCDEFRALLADTCGAKLVLLDARDPVGGKGVKERVTDLLEKARAKFPKIGCLDYVLMGDDPTTSDLVGLLQKSLGQTSSLQDLAQKEDDWSQGPNRLFRCYVPDGLLSINLGRPGN